ncbi:hypothetical protein LF1_36930 [Rubripirellula obstinata]|uniref:DUF3631 domain-containing protein n=1 Tax=Rubripirellula obstinata TaxID=406547 RepID=A0A5B1CMY8_9BACT|nr:ATP-binding protein [Rubripirellula obstinata]KAA1261149.1 hypothetical protein LF1_36930 [Rubripirellula obstinata]
MNDRTQVIENSDIGKDDADNAPDELVIEATLAGRNGIANVVCKLGDQTIHRDRMPPAKAAERRRFAKDVVAAIGDGCPIDAKDIEAELLKAADRLDAEAARLNDDNADSSTMMMDGDEVDATQVVRPELVLRPDVSAIAIPRIIRTDSMTVGQWLHFVRVGDERRVDRLGAELRLSGDSQLWLSPSPSEPTASDVKDLNRWRRESREAWLRGESSPTTGEVLRMVAERINRYSVLPSDDASGHGLTLAAWVMMTYVYPMLPAVPYLYLAGPPNSGKTRTMEVLSRMAFRPMMNGNVSASSVFRTRHAFGGVLLLDEAERLRDTRSPDVADLLSILLSGYRRGGSVRKSEPAGDSYRSVSFDCYGPMVIGCIKGLPPALSSRCITVRMMRAGGDDPQVNRSLDDSPEQAAAVLDALHCWALEHAHNAMTADCPSSSLANRDAELWGPLLRIVAHTGDDDAVGLLVDHAEKMTRAAAEDSSPEFDGLILTAYYRLRTINEVPTAGEVLERARIIDPESLDDSWRPRMVGGILRRYFASHKSNGRKVFRDPAEAIASIASRYGYDVIGGDS